MTILNYGAGLNSAPSGVQRSLATAGQMQGLQANQQNMNQNQTVFDQNQQALVEAKQQQETEQQNKMQIKQQAGQLVQNGSPDEIARFMINNPEIGKDLVGAAKFKDGAAISSRTQYAKDVYAGAVNPVTALTNRIATEKERGGDTSGLEETLAIGTDSSNY